jgi:hypothetical protein
MFFFLLIFLKAESGNAHFTAGRGFTGLRVRWYIH